MPREKKRKPLGADPIADAMGDAALDGLPDGSGVTIHRRKGGVYVAKIEHEPEAKIQKARATKKSAGTAGASARWAGSPNARAREAIARLVAAGYSDAVIFARALTIARGHTSHENLKRAIRRARRKVQG